MHYVKMKDGVVIEGPKPLSGDPTASPNIYWEAPQLAVHEITLVDIENQKVVDGRLVEITQAEKDAKKAAEQSARDQQKQGRENRKRAVLDFLKVPPGQQADFIKGLKELAEDGGLS